VSPEKPLVVYDGACGFCRRWIARWKASFGDRVEVASYQTAASRFPEMEAAGFREAVHLRAPDGTWTRGAEAVFRALAAAPGRGWLLWLYRRVPGFAPFSEWVYRVVAANRPGLSAATSWVWGRRLVPPGERLTTWIYLRLLATVYLVAFVSLWTQISGLAGVQGILPARAYLEAIASRYGGTAYWLAPTLAWVSPTDGFLFALCGAGVALSIALALGFVPVAACFGLWALYLSVSIPCQEFLWFQWDSLLLEAGFLAMFLAPWRARSHPATDPKPSRAALWLSRWLLFRLILSSSIVKLASGDLSWRHFRALEFHFETQPLPAWTSWYAHHASDTVLRAATLGTLLVEGLAPFLIFAPRRIRFVGAALIAGLQVAVMATGNYAFFNWLTLALCVLLLDDGVWPRRWREAAGVPEPEELGPAAEEPAPVPEREPDPAETTTAAPSPSPHAPRRGRWHPWVVRPLAALLVVLSLVPFLRATNRETKWLGPIEKVYEGVWPFRTVNHYGLFAVMTTRRPEIVIEGSSNGVDWLEYRFPYKPGDPRRMPQFVAPHQPRVDWQLWFAALSDIERQAWFLSLCKRLLEGSPPVLSLLDWNPFPRAPPRYLRSIIYEYRYTDPPVRKATGVWWLREPRGFYGPVLALEGGQLVPVGVRPDTTGTAAPEDATP
jgi:predicted DCC family thiol-disulfide oxidoreductase YuxK